MPSLYLFFRFSKLRPVLGLFLAVSLSLYGAGCLPPELRSIPVPGSQTHIGGEWKTVASGVERMEYQFATSTGASVILYRFAPDAFTWRFEESQTTPRKIADWASQFPNATVLVNGVYFHEDFSPSGLLISRGKRIGERQFDLDKSGMIQLAPKFKINDTSIERVNVSSSQELAQSYPFYFIHGKPAIQKDTGQFARRTFIATDMQGRVYLGIDPEYPVSLYGLMTILQSVPVSWDMVLNLDGGPSSGLNVQIGETDEIIQSDALVPIVIVGERKK